MSRTRSRTSINSISGALTEVQRHPTTGVISTNQASSWNTTNVGFTQTMTDFVSPGYFKTIRNKGHLPVNVMNKSGVKSFSVETGSWEWRATKTSNGIVVDQCTMSGDIMSMLSANLGGAFPSYSQQKAWQGSASLPSAPSDTGLLVSALANANTNSWDLGTFAAEFNKTVGMINGFRGNVARRASSIVNSLRARKIKPGTVTLNGLSAFSESWLEYRYGWRTLGYDLQDINVSLERLAGLKSRPNRGSAYVASSPASFSTTGLCVPSANPGGTPSTPGILARFDGTFSQVRTKSARASVMVSALANDLAFIDPLTTAWEIVPYSFIVDWFVNIGDLVKAYSPFVSGNVEHGCLSHSDTLVSTTTMVPSNVRLVANYPLASHSHIFTGPTIMRVVETETYDRAPATPSFTLAFKLNVDTKKLVDLSALFLLFNARTLRELSKLARL
jgi:hypothetical protein